MKNTFLIICFLLNITFCFGQKNKEIWTENEKYQYSVLTNLVNYLYGKKTLEISHETLFNKYIYFDYVLNDTLKNRIDDRLSKFDTIFSFFKTTFDSIGVSNFEAKPVRFYKQHKIYKPFDERNAKQSISGEKMYTKDQNVFAYYRKDEPENPLGVLLFDPNTNKLASWIMIQQGSYNYFLQFNLL